MGLLGLNKIIHIEIDTREQNRLSFPAENVRVSTGTIKTGDYALKGDSNKFAIERKSMDDWFGTVINGWERFKRELARMNKQNFPAKNIIVEGNFNQVCMGSEHSMVQQVVYLKRLAELSYMGCNVLFVDDAIGCALMTYLILKERQMFLDGVSDCQDWLEQN